MGNPFSHTYIMGNNLSFVSVIVPCRNEEKYIGKCLDSIISQDYPKENLEILVVDGDSEDETKNIVKNYSQKFPFIKLLENQKKIIPVALNIGLAQAKGENIFIMEAHASYEKDYISKCLKYLKEYQADNVGGIIKTMHGENTTIAKAIAFVLSHPFGVGSSYFRKGSKKVRWVDTVFGGCYKKEVFKKIGTYNENLVRSQDMEFNLRLRKAGGKILLVPEIVVFYYSQSNLRGFLKHNFSDGFWTTYPLRFGVKIFSWRHLFPLIFAFFFFLTLISGFFFFWPRLIFVLILGSYLFFSLLFSVRYGAKYLFLMPVVFFSRHFGYGLGSLWGLVKIII